MKKEERVALCAPVLVVQLFDPLPGQPHQLLVPGDRLLARIQEIRQQAEVQVLIPIRKEPDFQGFDQGLDAAGAREHRRDHHQGARFRRNPFGEVHSRQRIRFHEQRGDPVHKRDRQRTGAQQGEGAEEGERPIPRPAGMRLRKQGPGKKDRQQRDRAQIEVQGTTACRPPKAHESGQAHLRRPFHPRQSLVDQVESDMGRATLRSVPGRALAGKQDRLSRHIGFVQSALLRDLLDDMAVSVAGGEIHPPVGSPRVLAQRLVDGAHRLDECAPVHRSQEPEAADAVADGNLVGRLLLVLRPHQLLDRQAGLGKPLFDPGERQRQGGALSLQPAGEFRDERAHHRRVRSRHVRRQQYQALRVLFGDLQHLFRPACGEVPVDASGDDPCSDAPEILDQRQAQHDGDGPQFAQRQDGHRLVGRHEAAETFRIHPSIAVRDRLMRDVVHARQPGRRPVQQARQLPAVALRQVPLGHADLFFDQVEVVEEPFPGRRDPAVRIDRRRQQVAGSRQDAFILRQPGQKPVPNPSRTQPVRARQGLAVLLHLFAAEQFRTQRRFVTGVHFRRPAPEEARPCMAQVREDGLAARPQDGWLLLWMDQYWRLGGQSLPGRTFNPCYRCFRCSHSSVFL